MLGSASSKVSSSTRLSRPHARPHLQPLAGVRHFSDKKSSSRRDARSLTGNFCVETQAASGLTQAQQKFCVAAFYLATLAAIMTRPKKNDAANASSAAAKTTYKRKRKPGEERYYAVRSGRVPGVYATWAECQSMINGYAGAQCKPPAQILHDAAPSYSSSPR